MSFVYPFEDIISICMTVVTNILTRYNISPNDIGRLSVGTETIIDKSKSIKTHLMTLFPNNPNIEGYIFAIYLRYFVCINLLGI